MAPITKVVFDQCLAKIEWDLWVGQAYRVLDKLCNNLQVQSHLYCINNCFIQDQAANTQACNTISTAQAHIDANGKEYHDAHAALVSLAPLLSKLAGRQNYSL